MINKVILSSNSEEGLVIVSQKSYIRVFPKYEEDYVVMWEKKLSAEDETVESVQQEVLKKVKEQAVYNINAYDVSTSVNSFKVNGVETWLDKATRVGLMNSVVTLKALEKDTMTLWLNDVPYTVDVNNLQQLLIALEDYAIKCYNQTSTHLANVSGMSDPYLIEEYDYTQGYPDKLEFIV